jgi:hypothetical protein
MRVQTFETEVPPVPVEDVVIDGEELTEASEFHKNSRVFPGV